MIRAYADSLLVFTLCGNSSVSLQHGVGATVNLSHEGLSCEDCMNKTFSPQSTADYVLTSIDPCGTLDVSTDFVGELDCVTNCSANHVFGGSSVINPLDFMVSIQLPGANGMEHLCGGTLVAPGVVLTAAHCVGGHAAPHAPLLFSYA